MSGNVKRQLNTNRVELAGDDSGLMVYYTAEEHSYDSRNQLVGKESKPSHKWCVRILHFMCVDNSGNNNNKKKRTTNLLLSATCRIKVQAKDRKDLNKCAKQLVAQHKAILGSSVVEVERLLRELQSRQSDDVEEIADLSKSKKSSRPKTAAKVRPTESASLSKLGTYLENLYDESSDVVAGATSNLLQLAMRTETLDKLLGNDTLVEALARTLREEYKKSGEIEYNLTAFFFVLSHFSDFHPLLVSKQVGDMMVKVLELELTRAQMSKSKESKKKEAEGKQEKVLQMALGVLMSLAEDASVERKLKKRSLPEYLCTIAHMQLGEGVIDMCTQFLKRLSVYRENKTKMMQHHIVDKIARIFTPKDKQTNCTIIRLLTNLSFDPQLRNEIVNANLVPSLVSSFGSKRLERPALRLVYQLSRDEECHDALNRGEVVAAVKESISKRQSRVGLEAVCIALNISKGREGAQALSDPKFLEQLLLQGFQSQSETLLRIVKNILVQDSGKENASVLKSHFSRTADMAFNVANNAPEGVRSELLASLACVDVIALDLPAPIREGDVINKLVRTIEGEAKREGKTLSNAIHFLASLVCDELSAEICASGAVALLCRLLQAKAKEENAKASLAFAAVKLLTAEQTRTAFLKEQATADSLAELLRSTRPLTCQMAGLALDAAAHMSEAWADTIRRLRFEKFNQEWVRAFHEGQGEASSRDEDRADGRAMPPDGDEDDHAALSEGEEGGSGGSDAGQEVAFFNDG